MPVLLRLQRDEDTTIKDDLDGLGVESARARVETHELQRFKTPLFSCPACHAAGNDVMI